jgi:hypothetical protein
VARDTLFSFEWEGIEELARLLENMDDNMERILIDEYSKYGLLVEEGAKALAPKDKGDLTDTINSDRAKKNGREIFVEIGVGSVYGVYQHEKRLRPGNHPKYDRGAKFPDYYQNGYGQKTRSKPSWRGERPGRKYLERAVDLTEDDFNEMNERVLDRIMQGRR